MRAAARASLRLGDAEAAAVAMRSGVLEQLEQYFKAGIELGGGGGSLDRFREDPFSNHATAYSCITITARAGVQMPFKLWRKTKPTAPGRHWHWSRGWRGRAHDREEVIGHPLAQLLANPFPGRYASGSEFMQLTLMYLQGGGNAWWYKDALNSTGLPRSIQVFGTKQVQPMIDQRSGDLTGWKVTRGRNTQTFSPEELLHLRLPNPDDPAQIMGAAPTSAVRYDINRDAAQNRYDATFFNRGGVPPLALVYEPPHVSDTESLILGKNEVDQIFAAWDQRHAGAERAHRPALVMGGFKLQELGATRQDLLALDSKRWTRQQVAMVYGVPVRLLNDVENAGLSREDLDAALYALYVMTVLPLIAIVQTGMQQYLVEPHAPGLQGEFDADAIKVLQDDYGKKLEHAQKLQALMYPLNIVNERLDLGMDAVEWGDEALVSPLLTTAQAVVDAAEAEGLLGPELPQEEDDPDADEDPEDEDDPPPDDEDDPPTPAEDEPPARPRRAAVDVPAWRRNPRRAALWRAYVQSWAALEGAFGKKVKTHVYWLRKETLRLVGKALDAGQLVLLRPEQQDVDRARVRAVIDALTQLEADPLRTDAERDLKARLLVEGAIGRGLEEDLDRIDVDKPRADSRLRRLVRPYFERAIRIGAEDVAKTVGKDPVAMKSPAAAQYLEQKQIKVVELNATLRRQVRARVRVATLEAYEEGLGFTEAAARIRKAISVVYNNGERRARTIARTEIGDAIQGGRQSEYIEQGVREHEWVSAHDDEVRRPPEKGGKSDFDHWIDGEVAAVGSEFSNGLRFPHDPEGDAGNVINCRCSTIPVVSDDPIEA